MPLGRKVGLDPSDIVLHGDPATPPQKRGGRASNFRPTSIVAKRSSISATAEHLFDFQDGGRDGFVMRVFELRVFGPLAKDIRWLLSLCKILLESMQ